MSGTGRARLAGRDLGDEVGELREVTIDVLAALAPDRLATVKDFEARQPLDPAPGALLGDHGDDGQSFLLASEDFGDLLFEDEDGVEEVFSDDQDSDAGADERRFDFRLPVFADADAVVTPEVVAARTLKDVQVQQKLVLLLLVFAAVTDEDFYRHYLNWRT